MVTNYKYYRYANILIQIFIFLLKVVITFIFNVSISLFENNIYLRNLAL